MTLISGLPYAGQANLLFHGHRGFTDALSAADKTAVG